AIVGVGQGALVAASGGHPRVLEEALYARVVGAREAAAIGRAWQSLRLVLVVSPRVLKAQSDVERVRNAVPSLVGRHSQCAPTVLVRRPDAAKTFAADFAQVAGLEVVESFESLGLGQRIARGPIALSITQTGACACGKVPAVHERCKPCSRDEERLARAVAEGIDDPSKQVWGQPFSLPAMSTSISAVRPAGLGPRRLQGGALLFITAAAVAQWWICLARDAECAVGGGAVCRALLPDARGQVELAAPAGSPPYRMLLAADAAPSAGAAFALFQRCVDARFECLGRLDLTDVPGAAALLAIYAFKWLEFDALGCFTENSPRDALEKAKQAPPLPVLAATHVHRTVRGHYRDEHGKAQALGRFTAAYTLPFAGKFA
ncbi:MAG: hypothetical protein GY772_06360, partial [bacterium]|nr:hypothetical protein [bacterium]